MFLKVHDVFYILNFLNSSRKALIFLVSLILILVLAYIFHDFINLVSDIANIYTILVYIVLFLITYAMAVLFVDALQNLYILVIKYLKLYNSAKRMQAKEQSDRDARLSAIKRFLEHSPEKCIRPLRLLVKLKECGLYRDANLRRLLSIGAIEELVETKHNYVVFGLTSEAEPIVRDYFDQEREKHIQSVIEKLTKNEIDFLKLFEESKSIYEDCQGNELLSWETYSNGAKSLQGKKLIERDDTDEGVLEQWSLRSDVKNAIATYHGMNFIRDSLVLRLDKVQAIPFGGSGMKSS